MNQQIPHHRPAASPRLVGAAAAAWALPLAVLATPAQAFRFDWGPDIRGSFDSTLSYGVQLRMQDRSCALIARDNGGCAALGAALPEASQDAFFLNADNGDLNYRQYQLTSQAIKGTHELYLKTSDEWVGFVRFTESYDFSVGDTRRTELSPDAKALAVRNFQMLDLYVSKSFDALDRNMRLRVGNQVLSWGESTFVLGGINWINAIDVRRAHTPGTQLKEIFRPAPMASLNADVIEDLVFEGYYQWRWNAFQLDPNGTYFSSADIVGKGNERAIYLPSSQINAGLAADATASALIAAGLIRPLPYGTLGDPGGTGLSREQIMSTTVMRPRIRDGLSNPGNPLSPTTADLVIRSNAQLQTGTAIPLASQRGPSDAGQWGLSLHWRPEWSEASFGAYYLHYSEKIPYIRYIVDPAYAQDNPVSAAYQIEFPRNRELFGLSTNINVGNWALAGELSYRPREAAAIDPSVPTGNDPRSAPYACVTGGGEANGKYCRGWVDQQKWQTQATALQVLTPADGIGAWLLPWLGASEGVVLSEAALTYFPQLQPLGGIPWSLPAYSVPDKLSGGFVFEAAVTYPNAFNSGFNVSPQIDWSQGLFGNSPNAIPWQSGVKAGTVTLNLNRQNRIVAGVAYTWFLGGGAKNLSLDRDFLSVSMGYNF